MAHLQVEAALGARLGFGLGRGSGLGPGLGLGPVQRHGAVVGQAALARDRFGDVAGLGFQRAKSRVEAARRRSFTQRLTARAEPFDVGLGAGH